MLRRAVSVIVPVVLAVAACGMVTAGQAPASHSISSPTPSLPVLLPVGLSSLTTTPPANGFEYALEQSVWPVSSWEVIRLIAQCESGFDRHAIGEAGEVGPLQIHPVHGLGSEFDLTTYEGSLAAAAVVHEEAGDFSPWSCWEGAE